MFITLNKQVCIGAIQAFGFGKTCLTGLAFGETQPVNSKCEMPLISSLSKANFTDSEDSQIINYQIKPKGMSTEMKALDEYILMVYCVCYYWREFIFL